MQPSEVDIAHSIPDGMLPQIEATLSQASVLLGQFEVYETLVVEGGQLEDLLETDHITVSVLEDLHERTSMLLTNADEIADNGHVKGYGQIMSMAMKNEAPDISQMRSAANALIAEGWDLEVDVPELSFDLMVGIKDPFDLVDPSDDSELDTIDF